MVNKAKIKGTSWENLLVDLLLKEIGGSKVKRIAGSGAIGTILGEPLLMGDIVAEFVGFPKKFRIECKVGYGGDTQITVQREWLNKIREEGITSNSIPVLACKFSNARKTGGVQYFLALDFDTFCDIINYVDDLKTQYDSLVEKLQGV